MINQIDVARGRAISARWGALAERRLEYLTELFETGRWRRFYSELAFLENIKEAKTAVETWRDLSMPKTSRDKTSRDKTSRDKTSRDKTSRDKTSRDKTSRDKTSCDKTSCDKTSCDKTSRDKAAVDIPRFGRAGAAPPREELLRDPCHGLQLPPFGTAAEPPASELSILAETDHLCSDDALDALAWNPDVNPISDNFSEPTLTILAMQERYPLLRNAL
jgi:uncharacterized repeat protein (TIGR03809 family)